MHTGYGIRIRCPLPASIAFAQDCRAFRTRRCLGTNKLDKAMTKQVYARAIVPTMRYEVPIYYMCNSAQLSYSRAGDPCNIRHRKA